MTRIRPSTAISLLALFVALGGTSFAAIELGKGSVSTREIKNGTIRQKDIRPADRSVPAAKLASTITEVINDPINGLNINVTAEDGVDGATGPQGPIGPQGIAGPQGSKGDKGDLGNTGAKGDQGIPGGMVAYGRVASDGSLSLNSGLGSVTHPAAGIYCIDVANGIPSHIAFVTVEGQEPNTRKASLLASPSGADCNGSDFMVTTSQAGAASDVPFYIAVT